MNLLWKRKKTPKRLCLARCQRFFFSRTIFTYEVQRSQIKKRVVSTHKTQNLLLGPEISIGIRYIQTH